MIGIVADAFDQGWDDLLASAQAFDESCADRSKAWPPPIMTALAMAAANTHLRRFWPFLSHNVLRFSTSPAWYLGDGAVAPACIGTAHSPDRYIVWSGQLLRETVQNALETPDPVDAVTEAERLLAGWPEI
jgi:hypothetical protein